MKVAIYRSNRNLEMLLFEERREKPVRAKERINDKFKLSLFHCFCYIWRRRRDLNLGHFGEKGGGEGRGLMLSALFATFAPQC